MFKGFIFDLDGTVYLGDMLIPGADRVIRLLRESGKKVVYLSNKPVQTREDYALKLTRLGVPTAPDEVVNSTLVMINYLKKNAPRERVLSSEKRPLLKKSNGRDSRLPKSREKSIMWSLPLTVPLITGS